MEASSRELLSELIGLARATDGSEHLITSESIAVVLAALRAISSGDTEGQVSAVIEAKRAMVPNCFTCAAPCGRTSAFDLALLEDEPEAVQADKWELLRLLCALADRNPDESTARQFVFLGLTAIGTQPIDAATLSNLVGLIRSRL